MRREDAKALLTRAFPDAQVKDYVYVVNPQNPRVSCVVQVEGHRMHKYTLCGKRRGDTRLFPSREICPQCARGMNV